MGGGLLPYLEVDTGTPCRVPGPGRVLARD